MYSLICNQIKIINWVIFSQLRPSGRRCFIKKEVGEAGANHANDTLRISTKGEEWEKRERQAMSQSAKLQTLPSDDSEENKDFIVLSNKS